MTDVEECCQCHVHVQCVMGTDIQHQLSFGHLILYEDTCAV